MNRTIQKAALFVTAFLAGLRQLGSRFSKKIKKNTTIIVLVATTVMAGHTVSAQLTQSGPQAPPTLKSVSVPGPDDSELAKYIKDKTAAIALGKTLFWDMQVGSDGTQSCASCHFHAGTDSRSKNQINPGADKTFDTGGGPNYQLTAADYPFHNLTDPNNRSASLSKDINDVTGSQGIFKTNFNSVNAGSAQDNTTVLPDPVFNVNGTNVRQVTPRNTPSVINAVFNFRNFWDGRAQNKFNGVNPFGDRDPNAYVYKSDLLGLKVEKVQISLKNSAAASQAVGPPLTSVEESGTGRTYPDIGDKLAGNQRLELPREHGKKLRGLTPLGKQVVASNDSVLGGLSNFPEKGLKTTYADMIKKAFNPEWWRSGLLIDIDDTGNRNIHNNLTNLLADPDGVVNTDQLLPQQFSLIDYNFSLFMGLAIQMYESTLVSDNSPYDQYREGNSSALTAPQQQGLKVFLNSGCIFCHAGAEFTAASVTNVEKNGRITRTPSGSYEDTGFFDIGVTPVKNDIGEGANDGLKPVSRPLSETLLAQQGSFQEVFGEAPNITPASSDTVNADGLFKAPGLRNVELSAPYFHNGGKLTLRQVVDFYNRGAGDADPSGPAPLPALNLKEDDKQALVAFLQSLTDERVRYEKAPFDHPQLFVPNGHPGNQKSVTDDGKGQATDDLLEIPAVGLNGRNTPGANFLGKQQ